MVLIRSRPVISRGAVELVNDYVRFENELKKRNPRHRVIAAASAESVCVPTTTEMAARARQRQLALAIGEDDNLVEQAVPKSLEDMSRVDMALVGAEIRRIMGLPINGAGGLGAVRKAMLETSARHGTQAGYGLVDFTLLSNKVRKQMLDQAGWQTLQMTDVSVEGNRDYHYLGNEFRMPYAHGEIALGAYLFTGFYYGDVAHFVPSFRLEAKDLQGKPINGHMYPQHLSMDRFNQMVILGRGGFRVAQHFGILGVDGQLADMVLGHDGDSALFHFEVFLWYYNKLGDYHAAVEATKRLCVENIHAPQIGTIPRFDEKMMATHYSQQEVGWLGGFGLHAREWTNALFAALELSGAQGVVSETHWLVTAAEHDAATRLQAPEANVLLPGNLEPNDLAIFPDTLDIEGWLGMAVMAVLTKHCPGWQDNYAQFNSPEFVDKLVNNQAFMVDLAQALMVQRGHLLALLNGEFKPLYGTDVPENSVVFAALRRATKYKTVLLKSLLSQYGIFETIAKREGRPIRWLIGGVANDADNEAKTELQGLLRLVTKINKDCAHFKVDFLPDHHFAFAQWLMQGLGINGCWVSCTNPIADRSQGTEAQGPSILKALLNMLLVMGSQDGAAANLTLPTIYNYGPTSVVFGATLQDSRYLASRDWSNSRAIQEAENKLVMDFLRGFDSRCRLIGADLARFEAGRGWQAPMLAQKIRSSAHIIGNYNGLQVFDAYARAQAQYLATAG